MPSGITDDMLDSTSRDAYMYPKNYIVQNWPKIRSPEEVTETSVRNTYMQFEQRQMRFTLLFNYYIGRHRFPSNTNGSTVVSNLCGYITKALKGYIIGNRPQYVCGESDTYGQQIVDLFNEQNKWLTDSELIQDMSIYGRAFELVYRDKNDPRTPKSVRVCPKDAYVAYAGDVEQDSVFGAVRYYEVDENQVKTYRLYLYTVTDVQIWESKSQDGPWTMVQAPEPHGMGRVPLIEYANNIDYMGDFEQIIPLQDAYNQLLSDRLDDKTAFAQAMLKIQGSVIGVTADEIEDSLNTMKETKVLQLDNDSSADYLVKTMDESGVQVFQDQLKNDIHKEAMVPDLSDEQFANNASGVSMAYKLFGTDQMVSDKVAQYEKGFKRRCKLYDAVMFNGTASVDYQPKCDIGEMAIKFRFNTPQDLSYATTAFTTAIGGGFLSKQTAMENLSIVEDAEQEMERIKREQDEDAERQAQAFGNDYTQAGMDSMTPEDLTDEDEDGEEERPRP